MIGQTKNVILKLMEYMAVWVMEEAHRHQRRKRTIAHTFRFLHILLMPQSVQ